MEMLVSVLILVLAIEGYQLRGQIKGIIRSLDAIANAIKENGKSDQPNSEA
jgi:hypothetical protein